MDGWLDSCVDSSLWNLADIFFASWQLPGFKITRKDKMQKQDGCWIKHVYGDHPRGNKLNIIFNMW